MEKNDKVSLAYNGQSTHKVCEGLYCHYNKEKRQCKPTKVLKANNIVQIYMNCNKKTQMCGLKNI